VVERGEDLAFPVQRQDASAVCLGVRHHTDEMFRRAKILCDGLAVLGPFAWE